MNYDEAMNMSTVEFGDMPPQAFLLGLLSAFDNKYQASADSFFEEITWKQFFAVIFSSSTIPLGAKDISLVNFIQFGMLISLYNHSVV